MYTMKLIQTVGMFSLVAGLLVCFVGSAHAETTYLVNGKAVDAELAIVAAAQGNTVLQCKPVELKVSKSGTSVSLRAIKQAKRTAKR